MASGVPIIPVLVGGATASDLPANLKNIQKLIVRDNLEVDDARSLINGVEPILLKSSPQALKQDAIAEFLGSEC